MKKYKNYLAILIFVMSPLVLIVILKQLPKSEKELEGIPHNYWHPSWDEDNPRTIIPNGEGTITYGDTLTDSIRWNESDEYKMWITGDGDTIWE